MSTVIRKHALAASLVLSVWANQTCAGFWEDAAATLPGGLAPTNTGFWSSQVDGFKELFNKGRDGVAFGIWTEHPSFDYDNRSEENALPFGAGLVRTMIDEKGNERMLFGIVFSDSHYYPEPTFGYSWVARWPVSEKYHVGAGYMLGVTFREDYHWLPIPLPLPVVKAGTDDVGLYMTFIPFTNVFFFYGTIATDSLENRLLPTFETSPFSNRFELYGAWMWEKTDSATEQGYMVSSDAGYMLGARYFVADNWAVDFNYTDSEHDTNYRGAKDRTFDLRPTRWRCSITSISMKRCACTRALAWVTASGSNRMEIFRKTPFFRLCSWAEHGPRPTTRVFWRASICRFRGTTMSHRKAT